MKKALLLVVLTLSSLIANGQTREKKFYCHGDFLSSWYLTCKDGKYGAEDINGNEIIPVRYAVVSLPEAFSHYPCFIAKDVKSYTGYEAVYDIKGKLVIPLSRRYRVIEKGESSEFGTYYTCTNNEYNNYMVICDKDGKEVCTIYPERVVGRIIMFYLYYINNTFFIIALVDTSKPNSKEGVINRILFDGNGKIIKDTRNGDFTVRDGKLYDLKNGKLIPSTTRILTTKNPLRHNSKEFFAKEKIEGKDPFMFFMDENFRPSCYFKNTNEEGSSLVIITSKISSVDYLDLLSVHPMDETIQTFVDNCPDDVALNLNFRLSNGIIKVVPCVPLVEEDEFQLGFLHQQKFEQYDIVSISYEGRTIIIPTNTAPTISKMIKFLKSKY